MRNILLCAMLLLQTACASPGVIGVGYNKDGIVKYVFKNSNAEKAGMQLEDKILNTDDLRGKVNTYVLVKYIRSEIMSTVKIKRQHIDSLENPNYQPTEWK